MGFVKFATGAMLVIVGIGLIPLGIMLWNDGGLFNRLLTVGLAVASLDIFMTVFHGKALFKPGLFAKWLYPVSDDDGYI